VGRGGWTYPLHKIWTHIMHNALKTNNWLWIQTDLGINYYVGVFQTRPFYQAVLLRPTLTKDLPWPPCQAHSMPSGFSASWKHGLLQPLLLGSVKCTSQRGQQTSCGHLGCSSAQASHVSWRASGSTDHGLSPHMAASPPLLSSLCTITLLICYLPTWLKEFL
jgi:hypothetical protein